ncbi:MAG: TRAP transporter large permease subunit [Burkholderiales bacterium]|nr:TRAP transporter large permease subunit [Burkholderiales bacterium]
MSASAEAMRAASVRTLGPVAGVENAALAAVFGLTVALPLAEIALRGTLGIGIDGVSALVQHLTLALGMMGAAIAAREERLLAMATAKMLKGRAASLARFASGTLGATVAMLLAFAAADFVAIERAAGNTLTYRIPVWLAELPLPLGFALISARLAWHAAPALGGRSASAALAAALVIVLRVADIDPGVALVPALVLLAAGALAGAPIFAVLGGTALFLLLAQGVPAAASAVNHYSLVVNPSLPAIPMFTLAGYLLAEARSPARLVEVFDALFGRYRGGAAIVTVLACSFFTCFTGASGVTILALGGLVMPLLLRAGYAEKSALGLVTGAGLPGVLLMPALPLILYAIVARVSIEDMFLGGALPAALMIGIVVAWAVRREPRAAGARPPFDARRAWRAIAAAKWELLLPAVPIGALASGLATPVEAAALTAGYAFFVTAVVHRDLRLLRDLPRVVSECGLMIGGILLILGVALGLTNYLVDAQVPEQLVEWVRRAIDSRLVFLLALNALLLLAGCVMDVFTAIVVLAPLVTPIGLAYGVHPVHLGIVFLANLELGYLTPPVGMNLFFASYRFGKPIGEVFRAVAPLFLALAAGLLLITYLPWLSTFLPGLRG